MNKVIDFRKFKEKKIEDSHNEKVVEIINKVAGELFELIEKGEVNQALILYAVADMIDRLSKNMPEEERLKTLFACMNLLENRINGEKL